MDFVYPFVRLFSSEPVEHSFNQFYHLHYLHQPAPSHRLEFVKMLRTNTFSVLSYEKPMEGMLKIISFRKPTALEAKMKALFGQFHASTQQKQRMQEHQRNIELAKKQERDQLVRIPGSYELLKTIVRGVFFYNSKRLSLPKSEQDRRINLLSEMCVRRISAAVAVQRAWRGFIFRKKHQSELQLILRYQKAATMIQRWFRRLPIYHKRAFHFSLRPLLACIQDCSFCIDFEDYRELLRPQANRRSILLEQHAAVYKHSVSRRLVLSWDSESGRREVDEMIRIRKPLFSQAFLQSGLGLSGKGPAENSTLHVSGLERCDAAFLFHYQAENSLLRRSERTYLEVKCRSKEEAKLRVLGLALLSFDVRLRRSVRILPPSLFGSELGCRKELGKGESVIVCNENIGFIRTIEEQCAGCDNLSIYMINNKTFLQLSLNKKPFKIEERFFLYLLNFPQQQPAQPTLVTPSKDHTIARVAVHGSLAELTKKEEYHHLRLSTEAGDSQRPQLRKALPRKRSIRQFNAKVSRKKSSHPSFIIDNKSDRITHDSHQPTQRPAA